MNLLPNMLMDHIYVLTQHYTDMLNLTAKLVSDDSNPLQTVYKSYLDLNQSIINLVNDDTKSLSSELNEYATDYMQRSILFWDILRKRGNQYIEHNQAGQPPVLIFDYEMIIDGRKLDRCVNYALVEIIPPSNITIDKLKRPYVIIDPRAGHGSGIGGFKDDSQVGIALQEGHPVYFVIFFAEPEPGQTLHDITAAEEKFLRTVAKRHPNSPKPCVIGNCQGGWAVMALAAAHPDIAGVIVINGAPLAYWAGANGKNPMRYAGGILGGSWLAQYASDLGHGKFDGAHLVMNFEMLNPANTFWKKYYNLYSTLEKTELSFLNFERWWGGFTQLNSNEMRSIVENLFIGNKLAHGKIPLDHKSNIDLRNIRLPIIIFCSEGDNITAPEQALHWITDIYADILELKLAGQVIVYLVHQHVGHLGIFVSGKIAKKEHRQIFDLLNHIEHLPPGLYEMIIHDDKNSSTSSPHYKIILKERTINDILAISGDKAEKDEELFTIARTISELNAVIYDLTLGPMVRTFSNEYNAKLLQELHPMRMARYLLSDYNPLIWPIANIADKVRIHYQPIITNNRFFDIQEAYSRMIISTLDYYRDVCNSNAELIFHHIYGLLNHILATDLPFRDNLIHSLSDTRDSEFIQDIIATIEDGGIPEAIIRILLILFKMEKVTTGKHLSTGIKKLRNNKVFSHLNDNEFRSLVHHQTVIVEYDTELALETLLSLVRTPASRKTVLDIIHSTLASIEANIPEHANEILEQIAQQLSTAP